MNTMKHFWRALCASLLALICCAPLHAQDVITLTGSNYTTYLESYTYTSDGATLTGWRPKNRADLRSAKKLILDASLPNIVFRDMSYRGAMCNLEELVLNDYNAKVFALWSTKLRKVTIQNSSTTLPMHVEFNNSCLSQDGIISDRKFYRLQLHRSNVTDPTPFYSMLDYATFASTPENNGDLEFSGGKYNRQTRASVDDGIINPTNLIREIDMTRLPSQLRFLQVTHNLLTKIENVTQSIYSLMLNNNLLWSADLSTVVRFTNATGAVFPCISPQKPYADLTVVKGEAEDGSQDEVRLYLPEGQSELFDGSRLRSGSVKLLGTEVADQQIFGTTEKYFKLASVAGGVNADLDLYAKHNGFSYHYTACPSFPDDAVDGKGRLQKYMEVEVKTYPYIMYINPQTKSGQGVNYYSGTLWLDYDAIVPPETTAWIATGIKRDSVNVGSAQAGNQLVLEKIGDPGNLIPAGTAMYVRSNTQAGLYAFHKVWTHEPLGWDGTTRDAGRTDTLWYNKVYTDEQLAELAAQRARIGDRNILEGSDTITRLNGPLEALTLGVERKSGKRMIGFWPFSGTEIPAHRCYIPEATYRRLTSGSSSGAKGVTFFFGNGETTGITTLDSDATDALPDHWYTLDGRRLNGKPTMKGVYIHQGRKEVVR